MPLNNKDITNYRKAFILPIYLEKGNYYLMRKVLKD
jgi:hypothetical protein